MKPNFLILPFLLAACSPTEAPPEQNNQAEPAIAEEGARAEAPAPAPAQSPTAAPALTAERFGPLRIGMTRAEVVAALGEDANPDAVGGPDPASCDEFFPARAPEGMLVMIESGRLTRIALSRDSRVATDRGLTLGATPAAVRAAYGSALRASPHKYEPAPAQYLTAWAKDPPKDEASQAPATARGIVYEVGAKGTVQAIIAGGPSILYVEGCA
jgi:hypothetical protein